jgi:glycosyltransferase involved in cell wall biosynthesis
MKILIVTDAAPPQVNGVVMTLHNVGQILVAGGHQVIYLTPNEFKTFALPTYKEIRLAWNVWKVSKRIREIRPDAIHIATPEGTIGLTARLYCVRNKIPYTSSYHTKLPEYVHVRYPFISESIMYKYMRWLHKDSKKILVTTPSMLAELKSKQFTPDMIVWNRGVDHTIFNPSTRHTTSDTKTLVYVGRISIEKNIEAFLNINIPGTRKVVVGEGPLRSKLELKYPNITWVGNKNPHECAQAFANADVFVFPSRTDTFGIVMIESTACGTPVAAYPVTGPIDFVVEGINGSLNEDLTTATIKALEINRETCYKHTLEQYSWNKCADIFFNTLVAINWQ